MAAAAIVGIATCRNFDGLSYHVAHLHRHLFAVGVRHAHVDRNRLLFRLTLVTGDRVGLSLLLRNTNRVVHFLALLLVHMPTDFVLASTRLRPALRHVNRASPLFLTGLAHRDRPAPLLDSPATLLDGAGTFFIAVFADRIGIGHLFGDPSIGGAGNFLGRGFRNPHAFAYCARGAAGVATTITAGISTAATAAVASTAAAATAGDLFRVRFPMTAADVDRLHRRLRNALCDRPRGLHFFGVGHADRIGLLDVFVLRNADRVFLLDLFRIRNGHRVLLLNLLSIRHVDRVFAGLRLPNWLRDVVCHRLGARFRHHHGVSRRLLLSDRHALVGSDFVALAAQSYDLSS